MTRTTPIEYGTTDLEPPADRLLRRVVGWTAVAYAAQSLLTTAAHVALAKKWLASPSTMGWDLGGGWSAVIMAAQAATMCAMLAGGLLLLKRSPWSLPLLRGSAVASVLLTGAGLVRAMYITPVIRSYWSTPGSIFVETAQFARGVWVLVLLLLLTLPPLARRLV